MVNYQVDYYIFAVLLRWSAMAAEISEQQCRAHSCLLGVLNTILLSPVLSGKIT